MPVLSWLSWALSSFKGFRKNKAVWMRVSAKYEQPSALFCAIFFNRYYFSNFWYWVSCFVPLPAQHSRGGTIGSLGHCFFFFGGVKARTIHRMKTGHPRMTNFQILIFRTLQVHHKSLARFCTCESWEGRRVLFQLRTLLLLRPMLVDGLPGPPK